MPKKYLRPAFTLRGYVPMVDLSNASVVYRDPGLTQRELEVSNLSRNLSLAEKGMNTLHAGNHPMAGYTITYDDSGRRICSPDIAKECDVLPSCRALMR